MQDLTLVGLTEDKTKLVLVSDAGEEYTLPADARLRAALRGDHARLGQLEIQMESALRPRDIQARIRAGETPETVAAAAQTTVDRIMGYATPVLAERAHIAERAQRSSVRRKAAEGPARLLGDAVEERLRSRNVDPDSVEWDAWRREDGRWTLVADYRSGETSKHAEFVFDAPGRYVVAQDDEARWLVGEQVTRKSAQPRSEKPRRLSAVNVEEELPLGDDAIGMVTGSAPAQAAAPEPSTTETPTTGTSTTDTPAPDTPAADAPAARVSPVEAELGDERTVDLSEAAATVRRQEPVEPDPTAVTGDADWIATQASERPETRPTDPDRGPDTENDTGAVQGQAPAEGRPDDRSESEGAEEAPKQPRKRSAKKSRGRASVPSWDEIMFGGGRAE